MYVEEMITTHPQVKESPTAELLRCIEQCFACAQACTSCADSCLAEDHVAELRQCIRLNLDCADLCATAGRLATRHTGGFDVLLVEMLNACALACRLCGDECQRHASRMEHCRICGEACDACEEACSEAIREIRNFN